MWCMMTHRKMQDVNFVWTRHNIQLNMDLLQIKHLRSQNLIGQLIPCVNNRVCDVTVVLLLGSLARKHSYCVFVTSQAK